MLFSGWEEAAEDVSDEVLPPLTFFGSVSSEDTGVSSSGCLEDGCASRSCTAEEGSAEGIMLCADRLEILKRIAPTVPTPRMVSGSAAAVMAATVDAMTFLQPQMPACTENDLYLLMFFYLRRGEMPLFSIASMSFLCDGGRKYACPGKKNNGG